MEVYGVLQGSGSAPAIWLAVFIVLINTYNALFPTVGIQDPQNIDNIKKINDAFVDGGTLCLKSAILIMMTWLECKNEHRHGNS